MTSVSSDDLCTALAVLQVLEKEAFAAQTFATQPDWVHCRGAITAVNNRLKERVIEELKTRGIQ